MSSSDEDGDVSGMFEEPEGYRQPEKPHTFESFKLNDGREIQLRLVGNNPLWGHLLWNGARRLATYLQRPTNAHLTTNRTVLELGAGAGLPSLIASIIGASTVVVTDYPDADLIENLCYNIEHCALHAPNARNVIVAEGYLWGADTAPLTKHLPSGVERFDTLLLADLLFNHSEHGKLVRTVREMLARTKEARALVFFTPYRPWLLHRDLDFFDLVGRMNPGIGGEADGEHEEAEDAGAVSLVARDGVLQVDKLFEEVLEKVMFDEDPGDEVLRRTVFGYELYWADLQ